MNYSIFQDSKGNWSSKRIFGGSLVVIGACLKIALAVTSFFVAAAAPDVIQSASTWLIGFGAGLLGISVVEFLGK